MVHNGIIESAARQRPLLRDMGYHFRSETDTEVLVHLIDLAFRECDLLEDAVASALAKIEGTYGIAVVSTRDPGKIVVARNGSPVLLGIGRNNEYFVASDAAAVVAHTQKVVRLRDGDSAVLSREGYRTFDPARRAVRRGSQKVTWDAETIGKGGYDHFMYKEIREQPSSLRDVMRGRLLEEEGISRLGGITMSDRELLAVDRIVITACGTSWHAGLIGARMIEEMAQDPRHRRVRLRVPVPQPRAHAHHPRHGNQPIRRDRRHAGGAQGSPAPRLPHHGDRERGWLDHCRRDGLRHVSARRTGNRGGFHQVLLQPGRGARSVHALPGAAQETCPSSRGRDWCGGSSGSRTWSTRC